jgi:succinoglycan biosynthesis protein ExoO
VIAVYNAETTLASAIESALDQSLANIEVIAVDDGSHDGSWELLQRMAREDPRLRVFRRTDNGGPSAARNDAIEKARGKWIAILDADDAFLPERLTLLTRAGEAGGFDMVADNLLLWNPVEGTLEPALSAEFVGDGFEVTAARLARHDRPASGGGRQLGYIKPLIRWSFLAANQVRYPVDVRCGEDFHLYMECLLRGARMRMLPQATYRYTVTPDSTSTSQRKAERNLAHLASSNSRLRAEARQRDMRELDRELRRRGANIEFLRNAFALQRELRSRSWGAALNRTIRLLDRPPELCSLVGQVARRRLGRVLSRKVPA